MSSSVYIDALMGLGMAQSPGAAGEGKEESPFTFLKVRFNSSSRLCCFNHFCCIISKSRSLAFI